MHDHCGSSTPIRARNRIALGLGVVSSEAEISGYKV
jgi:hypothetical protein